MICPICNTGKLIACGYLICANCKSAWTPLELQIAFEAIAFEAEEEARKEQSNA